MIYGLEDAARLQYSRILRRSERGRKRLLFVWEHPDHPHAERFSRHRAMVVGLLECTDPEAYIRQFLERSLRTMTREIPAVIWLLWREAARVGS